MKRTSSSSHSQQGRSEKDKDNDHGCDLTGRFQSIPVQPSKEFSKTTLAAGAVVWRPASNGDGGVEILLIHRPRYDDWSLAKGKVDPGESLPMTASREIKEETGFDVQLGKLLGRVTYPVSGRTKVIYYWTAKYVSGQFTPNEEVDRIKWVNLDEALELVSYKVDGEVISKAAKRYACQPDTRILLVRHAHAHDRKGWGGDDNLRPLDRKGRQQAEMLAHALPGWKIDRIYSAKPVRCQTTVSPLSQETGLPVVVDELLGDTGWTNAQAAAKKRFDSIVNEGGVSVIVSQGLTIPDVIASYSADGTLPLDEIKCKKSSVWVLSFSEGKLCGADYIASPLPVK